MVGTPVFEEDASGFYFYFPVIRLKKCKRKRQKNKNKEEEKNKNTGRWNGGFWISETGSLAPIVDGGR